MTPGTAMLIIQCRLGKVVGHLFDRAFSTQTPTYSVILDLDQELQTFENELPPAFRNPTMDDKLSLPRLEFQQRMVTVQVCWIRSILHRRYLLKPYPKEGQEDRYARSRKIATMRAFCSSPSIATLRIELRTVSRTVINVVREILEESPPHIRGCASLAFLQRNVCLLPTATFYGRLSSSALLAIWPWRSKLCRRCADYSSLYSKRVRDTSHRRPPINLKRASLTTKFCSLAVSSPPSAPQTVPPPAPSA